ncbi:MAG: bacterial Ig-like domain-containing protein, partial [Acutalibacteraceae bacterium]|nr:bacterial Ig-like domain-containing protein [Acutalibacteraceae bacterium]
MKKARVFSKRALSVIMTIALLMTALVFFDIGAAMAFAKDAINVSDSSYGDKVYFYVPEQVYLKPSLTAHNTQERANFQWFVDAEINKSTHEISKLNTGEKTSGNLYFYYKNASSVSITFKYFNADFSEMTAYTSTAASTSSANYANMNSTIKFSSYASAISAVNTRTDSSRTRYSLNSNLIDTAITNESVSPYLLSTESGCYIEWTATFVDSLDGLTKTAVAYTYVYKPNITPAGNAMFIKNDRGYDHDNSAISWISGFHTLDYYNVGSHYPVIGQGNNRSILPFSSTNPEGYKVMSNSYNKNTDQYAQWAAYPMSNGYFAWDGSQIDNVDVNYFVTDNMSNSIFTIPSFNLWENRNSGPTGGDITFLNYGVSPVTQIRVDTSRYGNLEQIPNLTVGLMGTSNWSESGAVTGAWIVSDVKNSNGNSHYTSQLNTTSEGEARWYNYNSIIASGEDPYNPTGEGGTEGIKYNGKIKKNISGMTSTNACNVQASIYNEQGQDTGFNISILRLNVMASNKATLRDSYNNAVGNIAYYGINGTNSPYYKTDSDKWTKFFKLYKAAGQLLVNLDSINTVTVDGTSYDSEGLANSLNAAMADLETIRYSSQATVSVASLEKNADGMYVIKSIYDSEISDIATVYTKYYNFGDNVTFKAPEYAGYSFVGYSSGNKANVGQVVGADYNSLIEGADSTIVETKTTKSYLAYTFFYVPGEVSSIVNTKDGIFNYLKAKVNDMPSELGSITYPSYREHADSDTDFNYEIEGNDVTVWSTEKTTAVQLQFLPFYADLNPSTEYKLTFDVTGTDPENINFYLYNSAFTGGNGVESSTYEITVSGDTFTTGYTDSGSAYLKLELTGEARNGKQIRISNICLSKANSNELYIDTTQGYPAVYSAPAGTKTAVSYTANGLSSLVATTSYSTLVYDQYQLLPYYIDIQPNSTYKFTYDLTGLTSEQVIFELYSPSFIGGNGSTLNYYNLTGSGVTFTTGPDDDGIGQLRIRFSSDPAVSGGAKVTVSNLSVTNIDSKTTINGLYNENEDLGIPVKEGYKFCGWSAKSNAGGSAHGTINQVYSKQVYSYTFGSNIDIIEADWEAATCKVIFRNYDGTVISEQNITYGNPATAPGVADQPTKFGHTFAGWDTDFSKVTKNLIIEPVYIEKDIDVTVNVESYEIFVGGSTNVNALFDPNEPEISAVEWTSSNNAIATVNSEGVVTGMAQGTVTITGTIIYDGRTYSASTTVKVNAVEVAGIEINTAPDKTIYYTGENFDPSGLTIKVTYNNGETAIISEGLTFNSVNTTYPGAKTIRVTYEGYTTTTRITVLEIEMVSIEIVKLPYNLTYFVGDTEFEPDGIEVIVKYNNGDVETLDVGDLYFEGFDTSSIGSVVVIVWYEDFEDMFEINVVEPEIIGINVKKTPAKASYYIGDEADYTGLVLTATYSNGTTAEITEGYTVTGFDSQTTGVKNLTVTYSGYTAKFDVNVKAIELVSIEIVTPAEKTEYFVG